ncbi:MAG: RIP metalloprotease RseP, partial [Terriglobales bacterium]
MPQLLSILHTVFDMAIVLGFLILIHEFGHFAAAKYFGVRVEQFAIGFGKRLVGFHRGGTDYRINILPLGGYVKMSGENPMDDRSDDPGEFLNHPRWQRFIIAIAGPAMNIMLAIALLTGVYMVHYEYAAVLDEPTVVGWVNPNTPAEKAGIQSGDKIVRVEDIENPNWEEVNVKTILSPNQPLKFGIERDGKVTEKILVPEPLGPNENGDIGWVPKESSATLTLVEPGMPADKAGIKIGDRILTANGQDIPDLGVLIRLLNQTKDQPLQIVVLRNDRKISFTVKPTLDPGSAGQGPAYRIGIASVPTKIIKLNFANALSRSLSDNKKNSFLILELLQKMVRRKV